MKKQPVLYFTIIWGKIVFEKKWGYNLSEYKMDVSELAVGIYFYTVFAEDNILKSGKIIVQHDK